jgi:hypothetical protein
MFIPVNVEIVVGSICIGILPVRIGSDPVLPGIGLAYADMFRAECIGTKVNINGEKECEMDFTSITGSTEWVPEYRISDFTFGGVMVSNPKFDPNRIDSEDEAWLKKNTTGSKPKPAPGMQKP